MHDYMESKEINQECMLIESQERQIKIKLLSQALPFSQVCPVSLQDVDILDQKVDVNFNKIEYQRSNIIKISI